MDFRDKMLEKVSGRVTQKLPKKHSMYLTNMYRHLNNEHPNHGGGG